MQEDYDLFQSLWNLTNKKRELDEYLVKSLMPSFSVTEIYVIEILGVAAAKITTVAEKLYMTRGAISKLAKKMSDSGLITLYKQEKNRKEIYMKLTQSGEAAYKRHRIIRDSFTEISQMVYMKRTREQIEAIIKFVDEYNASLDDQIKKLKIHIS